MKRILLTTTSLILAAGVVSAETSISWSGAATAGIAREGDTGTAAGTAGTVSAGGKLVTAVAASAGYYAGVIAELNAENDATHVLVDALTGHGTIAAITSTTVTNVRSDIVALRAVADAALVLHPTGNADAHAAIVAALDVTARTADVVYGSVAVVAAVGDWQSYSEVSTTVTGSVSTDNGMTITAAVSVDAGTGYDFADDDGFDAAKTNGVGLDNITIATAMGTFKLDENAVTHLVDGDDDAAADLMYTNTFGSMSVSAAIDLNKDTDLKAVRATADSVAYTANATATTYGSTALVKSTKGTLADVAWSAKVSMPVAGGSAYVAMDEEGGNIFGASTTLSGVGVTFSSKLEALEEEESADRSNTVGVSYAMGATTLGASWNSVEDGDQWGISAAYAADGLSISASTDEGSDWSVSGSMTLGGGASVVAGTNYTEDAYLGLSFAF